MRQIIEHVLVHLASLRVHLLHLLPFLFLLVKSFQQMIAEFQIHIQITVHRHGKNDIPNGVQFFLREDNSAVCFFHEQFPRRRDDLFHTAVDLAQYLFVHVRDIHTALPNGITRITEVNTSTIEKCGELVVGIGEWNTDTLCHGASLYPIKF